ncbi:MAG: prephenate dehydratase [Candidatus Bipolaricaulia bacterium]
MMRIAFQGERGAYSEQAIFKHFGEECEAVPCHELEDVFRRVVRGEVDAGVVPIENSLAGSINKTYDLFLDHDLKIIGEIYLRIHHSLLGNRDSSLAGIRHVYSHPQALAQCEDFLRKLGVEPHPTYDTAGAAKWVRESGRRDAAAIASVIAAQEYGLVVLVEGVETLENNATRFLVISQEVSPVREECKTSIVFETRDLPAALYKCLGGFATNGVNLTKLESRPIRGENWKYLFYLDFDGHLDDPPVNRALEELAYFTVTLKVLSSYPKGDEV